MDGGSSEGILLSNSITRGKAPPIADVIESIGMGKAQMLVLLVGSGGIFLVEGVLFTCFTAITTSVTADLNLTDTQRGMLTTMSFIGLFLGVTSSGYIADIFGRRLPTVLAYGIVSLSLVLCSVMHHWTAITMAGLVAGFGVGFGMPPSIAMLSEVSPANWRIALRGATALAYNVGLIYICVFAGLDDPNLTTLHWRWLLQRAAIPCAGFCVLSVAFLPESPVFLAAIGRRAEAEQGLLVFARRNGRTISGAYELPDNRVRTTVTMADQLKIIFSPELWFITVASIYASFCMNVSLYGGMYANPQIFAVTSSVPAAWETLLTSAPSAVAIVLVSLWGHNLARKTNVRIAFLIGCTTTFSQCIGGSAAPPRNAGMEFLFQYGSLIGGCGVALGFVVLFQIAVEIFPPSASATGGALIIGLGRVGAIIAPELFDFMKDTFGTWQSFMIFMGLCSVAGIVLWAFVPDIPAWSEQEHVDDPRKELAGTSDVADYSTCKSSV